MNKDEAYTELRIAIECHKPHGDTRMFPPGTDMNKEAELFRSSYLRVEAARAAYECAVRAEAVREAFTVLRTPLPWRADAAGIFRDGNGGEVDMDWTGDADEVCARLNALAGYEESDDEC